VKFVPSNRSRRREEADSCEFKRSRCACLAAAFIAAFAISFSLDAADTSPKFSAARTNAAGLLVHTVESPLQSAPTEIQVLLPAKLDPARKVSVVYLLPVEAGTGEFWGSAMREVQTADLHNRHGVICVYPTFAKLPWFADHPTDARLRQETYFTHVVVPFIESRYPALAERRGRLLLGFSKSGWGAFSLLLRNLDLFGRAAGWDAPFNMDGPTRYGMGEILGTQENFERYRITTLARKNADSLRAEKRLGVFGYDNFREHHVQLHALLEELKIPHEYRDGPKRKHHWNTGWVAEAFDFLVTAQ
jgi:S-formylglutathione hydrolase FrmB